MSERKKWAHFVAVDSRGVVKHTVIEIAKEHEKKVVLATCDWGTGFRTHIPKSDVDFTFEDARRRFLAAERKKLQMLDDEATKHRRNIADAEALQETAE